MMKNWNKVINPVNLRNLTSKLIQNKKIFQRCYSSETKVPALREEQGTKSSLEILNEITQNNLQLTKEEFELSQRLGADLFLTKEKKKDIIKAGFYFADNNKRIDLDHIAESGWKLKYLKNMLLLQDYDNLFREFLQICCTQSAAGFKLTCESRFLDYITSHVDKIRKDGFVLDIEKLTVKQDYKLLRVEIYKNLKINRYENKPLHNYSFSTIPTPLGKAVVAKEEGKDISFVEDPRPFILATTMLIKTPMKIAILNQNMKKKLHGLPENQITEYVVRFETQLKYSDFTWVLPTQNKPDRLRLTKISDFNNVLRGNPFFTDKWDLIDNNERLKYMGDDFRLDNNVLNFINATSSRALL
jgi:hypothetical protein